MDDVLREVSKELPPLPASDINPQSAKSGTGGAADNRDSSRQNVGALLTDTVAAIFSIYGVSDPTDAQKMKAYFYLCAAAMAIVNDSAGGGLQQLFDHLLDETKELTKSLSMRIDELSSDSGDLRELLAAFPRQLQLTGSTTVNGLAALDALCHTKLEAIATDILNHTGGPFGAAGYAAIVVIDGAIGKGKSIEHFPEVSMLFLAFTRELGNVMLSSVPLKSPS
jgi:hypothetical protein